MLNKKKNELKYRRDCITNNFIPVFQVIRKITYITHPMDYIGITGLQQYLHAFSLDAVLGTDFF